jgi:hypothetical protein
MILVLPLLLPEWFASRLIEQPSKRATVNSDSPPFFLANLQFLKQQAH